MKKPPARNERRDLAVVAVALAIHIGRVIEGSTSPLNSGPNPKTSFDQAEAFVKEAENREFGYMVEGD